MYLNKDLWLYDVKTIAKKFVENNYSDELPLFDAFWQVFSAKINEAINSEDVGKLTIKPMSQIVTEISFAKGYSHDFVSPVVALTIAEVLHALNTKKYSAAEVEDIIHSAATRHGAKPSLTTCLIRSLPSLCNEIRACKDNNAKEAVISESPRPSEYRIWTEGKKIILGSIDKYEKNKDKYLFWIDLDANKYVSYKNPQITLDPRTVELLKHLVENIGIQIPIDHIIRDVYKYENVTESVDNHDKGKIAQHITQLNNFCVGTDKFDSYLFSKWRQNGLGLNNDFRDKYFLFKRVALDND